MMDAQRALLDELMGRNRDGDKPNEDIRDYRDRRVCKRYLCGLCPNDLFQNTKMDMGECEQWHLPKLRDQYEMERLNVDYGYEQELERELRGYQGEVEKKIARAQKRLEEQDGAKAPSLMDVENTKEVLEITAEIQETMQKAEDAGNEGEVDKSMELMSKVEALQQKKAEIQASAMLRSVRPAVTASQASNPGDTSTPNPNMMPGSEGNQLLKDNPFASTTVNQKLRVCDVCGAFLSIFDSDRRLADHFGGKLHLGYLQIRKKLEEIAEIRRERRRRSREKDGGEKKEEPSEQLPPSDSRSRSRQQKSSSRRSRSREKSRNRRSRSRSRERSRRRDRSRSRDRHSRRHRSRSSSHTRRHRSRSSSRSRRR